MSNRKKILLLSDDIRMHSGVATMSREMVFGTIKKYDWVQIAGAVKHPDNGKKIDLKSDKVYKIPKNASVTLYPTNGYGNPDMLRQIIELEKPDGIMIYTDPRFWIWLFQMEHEIRQNIPIMYYNIWDDLPDPEYNRNYYRSVDSLLAISKQTYGINKRLIGGDDWKVQYVPHGVSTERFFKVKKSNSDFKNFEAQFGLNSYKYKILYSNRNIRRKSPGDVIMAFKEFMDKLTPDERKECALIFNCNPVDEHGTDLKAVHKALCPDYPIIFTYEINGAPLNDIQINYLYNSSDVYINLASNEGFGLGSLEALMTGTPIIVNVTGGLQDQCGFKKEDGSSLTPEDYIELGSNHRGEYKEHGEWVKPVWPSNISCVGSPLTPYIFDDRCSWEDARDAMGYWYDKGPKERERCGEVGREWVNTEEVMMNAPLMGKRFLESIDSTFENWKPRERYTMEVA